MMKSSLIVPLRILTIAAMAALTAAGCGDDGGGGEQSDDVGVDVSGEDAASDAGQSDAEEERDGQADVEEAEDVADTGPELISVDSPAGCNPLSTASCAYPFPNMMLLDEAPETATGYRVNITPETVGFVGDIQGLETFTEYLRRADGFSIGTPILTQLGDLEVDPDSLPAWDAAGETTTPQSVVQLLNRQTGQRIPVWAETDLRAFTPDRSSVMIRTQVGLEPATEYVVLLTTGIQDVAGEPIEPTPGFLALRDNLPSDNETLEGMREEYETLFSFIEEEGVQRGDLLQAWSFVTFSDDFALGLTLPHVELARAAIEGEADAPCEGECPELLSYTITSCRTSLESDVDVSGCSYDDTLHPTVFREVIGTFTTPAFWTAERNRIDLDTDGAPVIDGRRQADFVIQVPSSLAGAEAESARAMVFGHGLLAETENYIADSNNSNGAMELVDDMGVIAIGSRWSGLSDGDKPIVVGAIGDLDAFFGLSDQLTQGMVDYTLCVPFLRQALGDDPVLATSDGSGSLLDPDPLANVYYGISQGGIFGTVFLAVSSDVKAGVLHVPTSMYSNVLQHSYLFEEFQSIISVRFRDHVDQQLILAYIQRLFDPLEPMNYARHLDADGALTSLGEKFALWQVNWGDAAAPDFNAFPLPRTIGAPLVDTSPHVPFGLDTVATPSEPGTTAMMVYDPGLGRRELANDGSGGAGPQAHGSTRRNREVLDQIIDYLDADALGRVTSHCDGVCNITPEPVEGNDTYP